MQIGLKHTVAIKFTVAELEALLEKALAVMEAPHYERNETLIGWEDLQQGLIVKVNVDTNKYTEDSNARMQKTILQYKDGD